MSKPVILCVDDEPMVQELLQETLCSTFGDYYTIEISGGGVEALQKVKKLLSEKKDLPVIVADYFMNDMHGDELLRHIHQISPKTFKIMLTGHGDLDVITHMVNEAKLFGFLSKPWEHKELVQIIQEATKQYFFEKRQDENYREQERYLATLMSNLPGVAYRRKPDPERVIQFMSQGVFHLTGYTAYELKGERLHYNDLIHPEDMPRVEEERRQFLSRLERYTLNYRLITRMKEEKWVWEQGVGVYSETGELIALEGFITDITERKHAEEVLQDAHERLQNHVREVESLHEQLREQSIRDSLTGVFNRRYLQETLDREIARGIRENQSVGLMMMDLDHFKLINDNYGHHAGDLMLQALGCMLQSNIRLEDIPCRYGGEEFVVVLPGAPLSAALERAEFLRERFNSLAISYEDHTVLSTTVSIGVTSCPEHGVTGADLLQHADTALYQAKKQGRNCVVVYQEPPETNDSSSKGGDGQNPPIIN